MLIYLNYFLLYYALPVIICYLGWRWDLKVLEPHQQPGLFMLVSIFLPLYNAVVAIFFIILMMWYYLIRPLVKMVNNYSKKKPFDYRAFFKL